MMFNKIDNHIVDVEGSYVISLENGLVQYFNFKDMTVHRISPQKPCPRPIRYDEESQSVMHWTKGYWAQFVDGKEAIKHLFHTTIEGNILED